MVQRGGMNQLVAALFLLISGGMALAQERDLKSYRLGSVASWSEAVNVGIKDLALSSPATPAEMDGIVAQAEEIAARFDVSVFREPDLLITDLFPADVAEGKDVLMLYQGDTLERYMALKETKAEFVEAGTYEGENRIAIARGFGRLLSYPDAIIDDKLRAMGVDLPNTQPFNGVWKSPTISLDEARWKIQDVACRNGCSEVSYEYFADLLADPSNDAVSVVDLYDQTLEFNRTYVSHLIRPETLQSWANYDAANDAALDCTPDGDGLQHQLTAPPAIMFEQYADRITIKYEYWNAVRTIHLDGRSPPDNLELDRLGYSVGVLDGNKLDVRTVGLTPSQISLMGNKFYLSEDAEFNERYEISEDGTRMEIRWSVVDPVNLRGPYTGMMTWMLAPGWELDVWSCEAITGEF